MRRHCRCSSPAEAGPRPAGCGATLSMIGPGPDPPIRRRRTATPRIAGSAYIPPRTWPLSRGTLQVDGYAGFNSLVEARNDASLRLAFCWAHARRPFYEFYTSTQSPLAAEVLARIAQLYEIEAGIRGQPPDVRQAARRQLPKADRSSRRAACLATGPSAAHPGLVRPGKSHALCVAPLGWVDPVSR